jgi:hypothetical protein
MADDAPDRVADGVGGLAMVMCIFVENVVIPVCNNSLVVTTCRLCVSKNYLEEKYGELEGTHMALQKENVALDCRDHAATIKGLKAQLATKADSERLSKASVTTNRDKMLVDKDKVLRGLELCMKNADKKHESAVKECADRYKD